MGPLPSVDAVADAPFTFLPARWGQWAGNRIPAVDGFATRATMPCRSPEQAVGGRAAARAQPARLGVDLALRVAASLPPAAVVNAEDGPGAPHGAPENILQSHVRRMLPAVLLGVCGGPRTSGFAA